MRNWLKISVFVALVGSAAFPCAAQDLSVGGNLLVASNLTMNAESRFKFSVAVTGTVSATQFLNPANQVAGAGSLAIAGFSNSAPGDLAVVVGGTGNQASNSGSVVVGGVLNAATGAGSFIGGGGGNSAAGTASAVPGGELNEAAEDYTFAAGQNAHALHPGTFVWADSLAEPFASAASNQFLIRASGGVGINTNGTTGKALVVGGDAEVVGSLRVTTLEVATPATDGSQIVRFQDMTNYVGGAVSAALSGTPAGTSGSSSGSTAVNAASGSTLLTSAVSGTLRSASAATRTRNQSVTDGEAFSNSLLFAGTPLLNSRVSTLDSTYGAGTDAQRLMQPDGSVWLAVANGTASLTRLSYTGMVTDGLVARWTFDGKSGADCVGTNNATFPGTSAFTESPFGNAMQNYSSTAYAVANTPELNANGWTGITVSIWLTPRYSDYWWSYEWYGFTTYGQIASRGSDNGGPFAMYLAGAFMTGGFSISYSTTQGVFGAGASFNTFSQYNPPMLDVPCHLVGTYDGQYVRTYVNGALDTEVAVDYPGSPVWEPDDAITYIGTTYCSITRPWADVFFSADYDDMAVWNRGLSSSEVAQLYSMTYSVSNQQDPLARIADLPDLSPYVSSLQLAAVSNALVHAVASGSATNANSYAWTDGTPVADGGTNSFTVSASGGIRLLGGTTQVATTGGSNTLDAVNVAFLSGYVSSAIGQAMHNIGPYGDVSMGVYTNRVQ